MHDRQPEKKNVRSHAEGKEKKEGVKRGSQKQKATPRESPVVHKRVIIDITTTAAATT
jgi:hypothetical protein